MTRIALDYDLTYNLMPDFWDDFIDQAQAAGHDVVLITYRDKDHDWTPLLTHLRDDMKVAVYCTGGVAKRWFSEHFGPGHIDIWIDDKPEAILNNSSLNPVQLQEWRDHNAKQAVQADFKW